MNKWKTLASDLSGRLELPEEALSGAPKLTVTASRRALVENHRGVLAYGREEILVATDRGRIRLCGAELCLLAMSGRELLIGGKLSRVEWE